MAFNRTSARTIHIEGRPYLWRVARHVRQGNHFLDILIAREDKKGATLIQPYETLIVDLMAPSLGPGEVKKAILTAREQGWEETEDGPQFRLRPKMMLKPWYELAAPNPNKSPTHALLRIYHEMATQKHDWGGGDAWIALNGRDRRAYSRDLLEPGSGYPDQGEAMIAWAEETGKNWGRVSKTRFKEQSLEEIATLFHQEMERKGWLEQWEWSEDVSDQLLIRADSGRLDQWWNDFLSIDGRSVCGAIARTQFDGVYFSESRPNRAIFIQEKARFAGSLQLPG